MALGSTSLDSKVGNAAESLRPQDQTVSGCKQSQNRQERSGISGDGALTVSEDLRSSRLHTNTESLHTTRTHQYAQRSVRGGSRSHESLQALLLLPTNAQAAEPRRIDPPARARRRRLPLSRQMSVRSALRRSACTTSDTVLSSRRLSARGLRSS